MVLKPQDIVVLLKLVALKGTGWTYPKLAVELGMSPSEVHAALKRTVAAHLSLRNKDNIYINVSGLKEFLIHGLKYVFIPERGGLTRGMPTCDGAEVLSNALGPSAEPPPVWPDPEGNVRGESFSPLYKTAPQASRRDPLLYELLVLVDAIRGGRTRERADAITLIQQHLDEYEKCAPKPWDS